jgi:hypothetical protein
MANTTISNAFISVNDIVNNFIISYTGPGKIIPDSKRTEVIFHARRCLQEFAYETIKSQFIEERAAAGTGAVVANTAYALPTDFVAVISAINSGFSTTEKLTEVSVLVNPLGTGNFFINYVAKTITYGDAGDATLTYLSNALTTDESAAIPKLAEEAMYVCMVYAILSNRGNTDLNTLQRLLIEKTDKLERAKSRLVFTNFS